MNELVVHNIIKYIGNENKQLYKFDKSQQYELQNIIDRWIIAFMNFPDDFNIINEKMRQELIDKHIVSSTNSHEFMNMLIKKLKQEYDEQVHTSYMLDSKLTHMLSLINPNVAKKLAQYNKEDVYQMLIRYNVQSNQWMVPTVVVDYLHRIFNVTIEAFASPINHRLDTYLSLYTKDKIFGSSGNFFKVDPSFFVGKSSLVNPPFVELVMVKMLNRLTAVFESQTHKNTRFFVVLPNWTDAVFYKLITTSKYKVYQTVLQRGNYFYETPAGKTVVATFNTLFVVLANFTDEIKEKYNDIITVWTSRR